MAGTTHFVDHAATTPMLDAAVEAVLRHLGPAGNASSLHASGRRARRVVEESRETIAGALGCRPGEVAFTSGGTEADNLALKGLFWARRDAVPRRVRVLTTAVEHPAVLEAAGWLAEHQGAEVELLPVDDAGRLRIDALRGAVERDPGSVAVVSVMWANNEVGTLQPVADVVACASPHGIPVHSDAVQAVGSVPVDVGVLGLDAVTLSGHKIGGPHGTGALVVRREVAVTPLVHGGGQERDLRSGTVDVPAVAGLAAAVEVAVKEQHTRAQRLAGLRDELIERVLVAVPDAVLNGPPLGDAGRLPGTAHLSFPGCEGDSLLMLLDAQGVECSTGSACSAGVAQASHVLLAMGRDEPEARSSLRFSLGTTSGPDDVRAVAEAIGPAVARARAARG